MSGDFPYISINSYPARYGLDNITICSSISTPLTIKQAEEHGNSLKIQHSGTSSRHLDPRFPSLGPSFNPTAGHHGERNGTPTYIEGRYDQAISLDGDGDYVTHGQALNSHAGTIAHWLRPAVLKRMVAYYEGSGLDDGWTNGRNDVLEIHSTVNEATGEWYFCYQDGLGPDSMDTIRASTTAQADLWTHVAATWDRSDSLVLCADGVEIGRTDLTNNQFASNTGSYHLIGAPSETQTGRDWEGAIDDVRVYDRALSPEEIVTVMNAGDLQRYYYALTSPANVYDNEPTNSKRINLMDLALLADSWLEQLLWPQ